MAYQQQGGLSNGPAGSGEHHGPQGTEYTLQGEHLEAQTERVKSHMERFGAQWNVRLTWETLHRCHAIPPDRMA